jgi:DNA (cytosine-5)-methyltransferase 1
MGHVVRVYYNDNEPFVGAWLAELVKAGELPDGDLDDRSIKDILPSDLEGYDQCHLFAGIGGWPLALMMAGWPHDHPVWTMSCPCQPFSVAGKGKGTADDRHLWPDALKLIAEHRPPTIFGEQVASKAGREWLTRVRTDLEALGYVVGAADLCAASVGAPHIRQRLYWVADADQGQRRWLADWQGSERDGASSGRQQSDRQPEPCGDAGRVEQPEGDGRQQWRSEPSGRSIEPRCGAGGMGDANSSRQGTLGRVSERSRAELARDGCWMGDTSGEGSGRDAGTVLGAQSGAEREMWREPDQFINAGKSPWSTGILVPCADGKARLVEPSVQPLAYGVPNRVGTLRGAGNAIVPQIAAQFIISFLEAERCA